MIGKVLVWLLVWLLYYLVSKQKVTQKFNESRKETKSTASKRMNTNNLKDKKIKAENNRKWDEERAYCRLIWFVLRKKIDKIHLRNK